MNSITDFYLVIFQLLIVRFVRFEQHMYVITIGSLLLPFKRRSSRWMKLGYWIFQLQI